MGKIEAIVWISGNTKPANRRLARKGGVKQITSQIYEETQSVINTFMEKVVKDTVTYTECSRRKTVTALDMIYVRTLPTDTSLGCATALQYRQGPSSMHHES